MSRPAWVIVLVEDERHKRFVVHYLRRKGYENDRQMYFVPLPSGRGCGEQWVRENYLKHVQAYRARASKSETALIVAIDADTGTVDGRLRQLERTLRSASEPVRTDNERIVLLVPRRNIETWILCLTGEKVDEDTDYKRRTAVDELIKPVSGTFFEWSRPNAQIPSHCVDSIKAGIHEIKRLD